MAQDKVISEIKSELSAHQIIIPENKMDAVNAGRLLINSVGLPIAKTLLYLPGVAAAELRSSPTKKNDLVIKPISPMANEGLGESLFGTQILSNLEIQSGQYVNENGGLIKFGSNPSLPLVFPVVLFTVNQQKNIVKTPIQGRKGTVKEYISSGDDMINIKLRINGENGHYPIDEVRELFRALDAPIALKVNSWFLQLMGVDTIVIDNYSAPQEEGGYAYQKFDINALSDLPFEIKISS